MRILIVLITCLSVSCVQIRETPTQRESLANGAANEKRIALSFDDAPRGQGPMFSGSERTQRLIETLRSAEAGPVVFFVTTNGLEKENGFERIRRYARAGHLIANHTHNHPWLRDTPAAVYISNIDQAEALLEDLPNRRPWFRYPFLDEGRPLDRRLAVYDALQQRGLKNGYVTIDNYDWYMEQQWKRAVRDGRTVNLNALRGAYVDMLMGAVSFYDQAAREALGRSPAHILLLHENDVAALFVDDLVAALRADGWRIISPDEAYDDPINRRQPTTMRTGQGRIAALAIDAGRDPRTMTHLAIEENQIDAMLEQRNVFGDTPLKD
ncbi:MAG: polysaccharide deacetylase family protein [Pseudomonadota bacterium]